MKRRALSMLLALSVLLSSMLIILSATAEETGSTAVADYTLVLKGGKAYKNSADGEVLEIAAIKWEPDSAGVYGYTFRDLDFETTAPTAVKVEDGLARITVVGRSCIKGGDALERAYTYGINANALEFYGDGYLDIYAGESKYGMSYGIFGNVYMYGGNVSCYGGQAEMTYGAYGGNFKIYGGTLKACGCENSTHASRGIYANVEILVDGGQLIATGGKAYDVSEGANSNGITVKSGKATFSAGEAESKSFGAAAHYGFTVSGGTVIMSGHSGASKQSPKTLGMHVYKGNNVEGTIVSEASDWKGDGSDWKGDTNYWGYHYLLISDVAKSENPIVVLKDGKVYSDYIAYSNPHSVAGITPSTDPDGGYIYYLNGVVMSNQSSTVLRIDDPSATLFIRGTSKLIGTSTDAELYGIYAAGDLTVKGDGKLHISAGTTPADGGMSTGLYVGGDLTVDGVELVANGGAASESYGIKALGDITVKGSTLCGVGGNGKPSSYGIRTVCGGFIATDSRVEALGGKAKESFGLWVGDDAFSDELLGSVTANIGRAEFNSCELIASGESDGEAGALGYAMRISSMRGDPWLRLSLCSAELRGSTKIMPTGGIKTEKMRAYRAGSGTEDVRDESWTGGGYDNIECGYLRFDVPPMPAVPTISGEESFDESVTVTISSATPEAIIYYTLDGSIPDATKLIYSAPFTLTESTTVNARAVIGTETSDVSFRVFTKSSVETENIGDMTDGGDASDTERPENKVFGNCRSALAGPLAIVTVLGTAAVLRKKREK